MTHSRRVRSPNSERARGTRSLRERLSAAPGRPVQGRTDRVATSSYFGLGRAPTCHLLSIPPDASRRVASGPSRPHPSRSTRHNAEGWARKPLAPRPPDCVQVESSVLWYPAVRRAGSPACPRDPGRRARHLASHYRSLWPAHRCQTTPGPHSESGAGHPVTTSRNPALTCRS